jgi:lipid-A-disaccharide synthase-like uncharacterized protein
MIDLIATVVGWIGMALILIAYFLLTSERVVVKSWIYHTINLLGGAGLIFYTYVNRTVPVMVLNILWVFIAISALIKIINRKNKKIKRKK